MAKDLVEDYINQFQELIDIAEHDDDKTIVIKFHKGLDPAIQNKVALTRDNALDFDDPEGWYEAAWKVAWNWEANKAFVESRRGISRPSRPPIPTPKAAPSPTYVFGVHWRASFQSTQICTPGATPSSLKDGPEPMDVDWTHGQTNFPIICWHCNKPGHYARECPNAFDVQIVIESGEVTYTSQYRIQTENTTIIHRTDTHTFITFESIKRRTDQNIGQKTEMHILGLG